MADDHYMETFVGSLFAALAGAWKWVRGRERRIHARLNDVEARIVTNDRRLAILETQRLSDQDRMKRIEGTIVNIDKKQDEQMKILVELAGRQGRRWNE